MTSDNLTLVEVWLSGVIGGLKVVGIVEFWLCGINNEVLGEVWVSGGIGGLKVVGNNMEFGLWGTNNGSEKLSSSRGFCSVLNTSRGVLNLVCEEFLLLLQNSINLFIWKRFSTVLSKTKTWSFLLTPLKTIWISDFVLCRKQELKLINALVNFVEKLQTKH